MIEDKTKILELLQDFSFVRHDEDTLIGKCDHYNKDSSVIEEALHLAGYKYYKKAVVNSSGEITVTLLMSSHVWEKGEPHIFLSLNDFWDHCTASKLVPSLYIMPDEDIEASEKICIRYKSYLKLKDIICKVSDYNTDSETALLLCNNGESVKAREFPLLISRSELALFKISEDKENSLDSLVSFFQIEEDVHSHERNNVLKNVIVEFLEKNATENLFSSLYNSADALFRKYKEQYKLYVDRFSVNKVLKEISEKNLEYSSKVNEFISSGQTKAFAIPGAMIAIGTIVRTQPGFLSSMLIMIGLCLVNFFVISANQVYLESYQQLKEQVSYTFDNFKELDSSTEVFVYAERAKCTILERISKAESRLSDISFFSSLVPWFGGVYLIGNFIIYVYT